MENNKLNTMEMDAIGEILNISLGASATALSNMLNRRAVITTPVVTIMDKEELVFDHMDPAVGVGIEYVEGLTGSNVMLLRQEDVRVIVSILMGSDIPAADFVLDEMTVSAICEVMNQMMGASATALSELLTHQVNISTPQPFAVDEVDEYKERYLKGHEQLAVINFNLQVGDELNSEFINIMPLEMAKELVAGFFQDMNLEMPNEEGTEPPVIKEAKEEGVEVVKEAEVEPPRVPVEAPRGNNDSEVLSAIKDMIQLMQAQMNAHEPRKINAETAPLPNLNIGNGMITPAQQGENMELIMGVPMEISVEIGRTKKLVKDILELNKGSLVVLDKLTGEPVDLYVNGQCIAKGDVVVVEDNFGVRITEILAKEFMAVE
ncbi:flagellar motor switch protein FliN/FliY [Lachnospiraceae bacterium PF1-21]|uniref:Flagellar motor switch phosphatase FliY n=1 Tax=Ohessyouella blattaphilus TaxID=2949333 RepID=A0ABT1EEK6_9FIRM|nr:flagellar motor switch phosphatase FliY [Ohessyouella blattaphilus]MCP1109130.1 flagellar motor switch phosphatase FliY [Ohessyouella blattaphilus]MCR8562524.1 flagellar motor switch phosphatase FliY [Ohessyouella blattaphilus]